MNTNSIASSGKNRIPDIDLTKAIGILLVAFGHFGAMTEQPGWFLTIKEVIYTFHMPMFILLSGYLFGQSKANRSIKQYLIIGFRHLIIPYLIFALIFDSIYHIITGDQIWWQALFSPLYKAPQGHAVYLWFLPVLFFLQQIARLTKKLGSMPGILLFGLLWLVRQGIILPEWSWQLDTPLFFLSYLSYYGIYFFIGWDMNSSKKQPSRIRSAIFTLLFAAALWIRFNMILCHARSVLLLLALAITGSLAVWNGMKLWQTPSAVRSFTMELGRNSYIIYLLHPLIMYPFGWAIIHYHFNYALMLFAAIVMSVAVSAFLWRKLLPRSKLLSFILGTSSSSTNTSE
ncbi:acyltransferase family protein [Porphyromonas macacae]|uniref:acyltransferase family protein n=1 Tax=Porphyromonas macacae TaxID=28115 RepID=UPI0035A00282